MTTRTISQRVVAEYEKFKQDTFSQRGEDGVIDYFLKKMGINSGYFVEFGAWDGKHLSNCANLAEQGWSGCFIEGSHERFLDLLANYGDNDKVDKVNCFIMPKGDSSLDSVLAGVGAPKQLDVLSIDIDGYDYAVWEHLVDFDARLVIVEYNPTIPANVVHIQDEYDQTCFGNSLAAFWELGLKKGYRLIATTEWNAFFATKEDCEKFNISSFTPWEIKDTTFETHLFHGYNGQIKLAGSQMLVWHGVPLKETDFQILPQSLQKIPVGQSTEFFSELDRFKSGDIKSID
jgi:hypothetical protein